MAVIPEVLVHQQYNMLSSHDTPRIASIVERHLLPIAIVLQFTLPGIPAIYYGDEVGTTDHPFFSSRYPADTPGDKQILAIYADLIHKRKHSKALQHGSFRILSQSRDSFVFVRSFKDDHFIVGVNRGADEVSMEIKDFLLGELSITIKSFSYYVENK